MIRRRPRHQPSVFNVPSFMSHVPVATAPRSSPDRRSRCARFRLLGGATLLWSTTLAGCCFWRNQNPVDEHVVLSRQFARQGVNAMERCDWSEAERLCAQAVRSAPNDAEARRHYADVLWARRRTDEALVQIETAVEIRPDDPHLQLRAAEMHLDVGRTADALADVQRAIDLNPKLPQAWLVRGRVHRRTGDPRQALADIQRALSFDPRNRDGLEQAAAVYQQLGEPHRALVYLQALVDTYPAGEEPQSALVAQGMAYAAMQRHADAADALAAAASGPAPGADVLVLLAEAQTAAGRPTEAFAAAQRALAAAPDDPRCRSLLQRTAIAMQPPTADATLRR